MTMECRYPQHHKGGGDGPGLLMAAVCILVAGAIAAAIVALAHVLMLGLAGFGLLSLTAGALYLRYQWRKHAALPVWQRVPHMLPQRDRYQVPRQQPQAVESGQHLHLHLDGMAPQQAEAILRRIARGQ